MELSKAKEKLMKKPLPIASEEATPSSAKSKMVYEVDRSEGLAWSVFEHEVVDNKIIKTTLIARDVPLLAKSKLEQRLYMNR